MYLLLAGMSFYESFTLRRNIRNVLMCRFVLSQREQITFFMDMYLFCFFIHYLLFYENHTFPKNV